MSKASTERRSTASGRLWIEASPTRSRSPEFRMIGPTPDAASASSTQRAGAAPTPRRRVGWRSSTENAPDDGRTRREGSGATPKDAPDRFNSQNRALPLGHSPCLADRDEWAPARRAGRPGSWMRWALPAQGMSVVLLDRCVGSTRGFDLVECELERLDRNPYERVEQFPRALRSLNQSEESSTDGATTRGR